MTSAMCRACCVGLMLLSMLAMAGRASAQNAVLPVEVVERGGFIDIDNGLVRFTLDVERGRLTSMRLGERELFGEHGFAAIQFYGQGNDNLSRLADPPVAFRQRTRDVVDIACRRWRNGFLVEMHYVVKAGEPGFYNYIVIHHDPAVNPGDVYLEQVNLLVRADPEIFDYATIGEEKSGHLPSPQRMRDAEQIMDATYRLEDGTVDAKYDWTLEEDGPRVFGLIGDEVGLFIVKDSGESLNAAPIARELTVHATTLTPVLLRHFTAAHYGRGKIHLGDADEGWSKIAGPWFVYANEGESKEQMWSDAVARAERAADEWPYPWLEHPLYARERGTVSGTLELTDGSSPQDAMVLIGPPPSALEPNWRQSGRGYFFWSRADADGSFEINKVRPGRYHLWVVQDGKFGDHHHDADVVVEANQNTDVGTVAWTPDVRGEVLWQIGTPDRTAGEFKHGDDYRHWGLWLKYPDDFPDDVDFVVGTSNEREDWNYVQPAVASEEGTWRLPVWTVRFELDEPATGTAYLRMGVAAVSAHAQASDGGPRWAGVAVALNGEPLQTFRFPHDSGVTRSAHRGNYHEVLLPIDADELRVGENVLALQLASNPPDRIDKNFPYCSIAYDALRFELDRAISVPE